MEKLHDAMVAREGVFEKAVKAIRKAKDLGYRVNTNTTVFNDSAPEGMRELFNFLNDDLGVDGMMISPGYDYPKAPNQKVFLNRPEMIKTFETILDSPERKKWRFNHSPIFLKFLQGKKAMQCTAWGNPTRSVLGWQRPCYLMNESYADSFIELMEETEWDRYGFGRDARCTNCMAHCGYEPTAVGSMLENPLEGLKAAASTIGGGPSK